MKPTQVQYFVNGVASTVWSRIVKSKTTYIVLAFVLAQAETLFDGKDWTNPIAWRQTGIVALGGAALIMIRAGQIKSELAANAVNPALRGVEAVEVRKDPSGAVGTAAIMAVLASALGLAGCTDKVQGKFCYTDGNGNQVCLPLAPPPPPPPPPPSPTPVPILPAAKSYTLEK